MKLNIIIEVKDSEVRYVAENKFRFFKFVVVRKKCTEFARQKGNLKPEYRLYASLNSLLYLQFCSSNYNNCS